MVAGTAAVIAGLVAWSLVPTTHGSSGAGQVAVGATGSNGPGGTSSAGVSTGGSASASGPATAGGSASGLAPSGAGAGSAPAGGGIGPASSAGGPGGPSARPGAATTPGPSAGTGPGSESASSKAPCGASSANGVTNSEIHLADALVSLAGAAGNQAVGQASPQVQQAEAQAVVDDINSRGGVDCRKLVVTFYPINVLDPTASQNACLQMAQQKPFAVIDQGGLSFPAGAGDCLAQHKIPLFSATNLTPSEAKQYYPYLISPTTDAVVMIADAVQGMNQRGFFSAAQGFSKLGVLQDNCNPEVNQAFAEQLGSIGVTGSRVNTYSFSCPTDGFASPSDMSAAVVQFKLAHVTNVIPLTGEGSFSTFTKIAAQQGFHPKYTTTDYQGFPVTSESSTAPDGANFDGTISVTNTRYGQAHTPSVSDPATNACIAVLAKKGLPKQDVFSGADGGGVCTQFYLLAAAAGRDPGLSQTGLAPGLDTIGRQPMSYFYQDSIYNRPGKVSGGDFWWYMQFHASCTCWKVLDPTEHPSLYPSSGVL